MLYKHSCGTHFSILLHKQRRARDRHRRVMLQEAGGRRGEHLQHKTTTTFLARKGTTTFSSEHRVNYIPPILRYTIGNIYAYACHVYTFLHACIYWQANRTQHVVMYGEHNIYLHSDAPIHSHFAIYTRADCLCLTIGVDTSLAGKNNIARALVACDWQLAMAIAHAMRIGFVV